MDSPFFIGKRIKVQIVGSRAVLRDPGWRNGDYEGRFGIWVGTEDNLAKVTLGTNDVVKVPPKYIRPVRPSIKGQNIITVDGVVIGLEYHVVAFGSEECTLHFRDRNADPKTTTSLSTNLLAVVL